MCTLKQDKKKLQQKQKKKVQKHKPGTNLLNMFIKALPNKKYQILRAYHTYFKQSD